MNEIIKEEITKLMKNLLNNKIPSRSARINQYDEHWSEHDNITIMKLVEEIKENIDDYPIISLNLDSDACLVVNLKYDEYDQYEISFNQDYSRKGYYCFY